MKKVLLILALALMSAGAFAQKGDISGHAKAGLKFDPTQFGIGAEARYGITNDIRGAVDMLIFLPKDKTWGLDFNLNAHYVFNIGNGLDIYPLAGLNIANARRGSTTDKVTVTVAGQDFTTEYKTESWGRTNFGFNIGCGVDYDLSAKNYLNAEFKYTFANWDYAQLMIGYGFRF